MKNSFYVFLSRIFLTLSVFIFNFIISSIFGDNILGNFLFVVSVLNIIIIFSKLGLDQGLLYFIPKNNSETNSLIVTKSIKIVAITSLLLSLLVFLLPFSSFINDLGIEKGYLETFSSLSFIIFLQSIVFILQSILNAKNELINFSIGRIIFETFKILFIILLFQISSSESILFVSIYFSYILTIFYYIISINNKTNIKILVRKTKSFEKLLRYSLLLIFSNIFLVIMGNVDKIMIGLRLNNISVAIYTIGFMIGTFISIFNAAIVIIITPKVSFYVHKDLEKTKKIYKLSSTIEFITCSIFFAALIFFGKFLLNFYGEIYEEAYNGMLIVAFGQLIRSFVGQANIFNNLNGKSKYTLWISLFSLILNITLNFILISILNIFGAAIATSITLVINIFVHYLLAKRDLGISMIFRIKFIYLLIYSFTLITLVYFYNILYINILLKSIFALALLVMLLFSILFLYIKTDEGAKKELFEIFNFLKGW